MESDVMLDFVSRQSQIWFHLKCYATIARIIVPHLTYLDQTMMMTLMEAISLSQGRFKNEIIRSLT